MKLSEIRDILRATVLCGADRLDLEVRAACGSDFMSDVLAYVRDQELLLTGLIHPQVVRTADVMNIRCLAFVRGKQPDEEILSLAREYGIVVMATDLTMYLACGMLYASGLEGR